MIRTAYHRPARPGFTLVELMVAAAVCALIMALLATVFQSGIDTVRQMRSTGDMADQLRSIGDVMKRDIQAPHFLTRNGPTSLSDQLFNQTGWTAPTGGYVLIRSGQGMSEGTGTDNVASTRPQDVSTHSLQFTSILSGMTEQDTYTVTAPIGTANVYRSRAAEVAYFLSAPTPQMVTGGASKLPLYNLMRRQRLVTLSDTSPVSPIGGSDADVLSMNGSGTINTMATLANGSARTNLLTPFSSISGRFGDDVILSNVISFEVKVDWQSGGTAPQPRPFGIPVVGQYQPDTAPSTSDYPFDTLTQFPNNQFDSTNPSSVRVVALQVRVRVYDPKLQNARQSTFVFNP